MPEEAQKISNVQASLVESNKRSSAVGTWMVSRKKGYR